MRSFVNPSKRRSSYSFSLGIRASSSASNLQRNGTYLLIHAPRTSTSPNCTLYNQFEKNFPTYRRHSNLTLKPSPYPIINPLGFSPARIDAFVGIALMAVEALCAWGPLIISSKKPIFLHFFAASMRVVIGH